MKNSKIGDSNLVALKEVAKTVEEGCSNFSRFSLAKMPQLAQVTNRFMPGVYLITAETNVGKTSCLTSLAKDILESNPSTRVVYLSMDDPTSEILRRIVASKSGVDIQTCMTPDEITDGDQARALEAIKWLEELMRDQRLAICDNMGLYDLIKGAAKAEKIDHSQIMNAIEFGLFEGFKQPTVVLIDHYANLNSWNSTDPSDNFGRMMTELQRLTCRRALPIICTTEQKDYPSAGKTPKPSGSSKNPYASRCLFHLRRSDAKEHQAFSNEIAEGERLLILETLKNKASGHGTPKIHIAIDRKSGGVRTLDSRET